LIHNPNSNYYHVIKEKLELHSNTKSRQRLKDESVRKANGQLANNNFPLFKSPTMKFNMDKD